MKALQSPRGTRDILPSQQAYWQYVKNCIEKIVSQVGFLPITTPTYEDSALFQRSIGEGTDVVDKELFLVKGVRSEEDAPPYALRPEATAGIVRAFIEHGLHTLPQPVKLYSILSCFRYDRPQKGRYREHIQLSLEYFGDTSAFSDALVILTQWLIFQRLGLKNIELKLNTLGTSQERTAYCAALKEYFTQHKDKLSADSAHRLEINPLRILDSKDGGDQKVREGAPKLGDFLSQASADHFNQVQTYLSTWQVPFNLDPYLVRGLDYYSHTTFEWIVATKSGQQDSLGGGGRYDDLVTQLGGQATGAVGEGMGLDRVIEEMINQEIALPQLERRPLLYLIAADALALPAATEVFHRLLQTPWRVEANLEKTNVGNQLKAADRLGATFALLIGQQELDQQSLSLKDLRSGEQHLLPLAELEERLNQLLA